MNLIKSLPLEYLVANFYPHLYGLHTLSEKVCIHTRSIFMMDDKCEQ